MYHHRLIKIIIQFHLNGLGHAWENFLLRIHFKEEEEEEQVSSSKGKIGRKRVYESPIKNYLNNNPSNNQRMKFLLQIFQESLERKLLKEIKSTKKKKTHPRKQRRSKQKIKEKN